MSSGITSKYLVKKKKDLVEYAKILESIISLETNTLWKSKTEFTTLAKEVVSFYVDHFYFDNNAHRDNPVEYSNDNINLVLKSLIEYCKNTGQSRVLQEKKNEAFLLSVIICTACYVDISANVFDGNFTETKNKFKYLLQYLQKTNILKIYINNKVAINELFNKIKESNSIEDKFFEAFVNENAYNEYKLYAKEPVYYMTNFVYHIEGLEGYDEKMVREINQSYEDKYLNISYELLSVEILKELLGNEDVRNYLVPITKTALKKENSLTPLNDDLLKKYVQVLVNFEDAKEFKEDINKYEALGFKFIYEFDKNGEVSPNTFVRNMTVLVTDDFLKANEEKLYSWKNQGINFVIKNIEEDVQ